MSAGEMMIVACAGALAYLIVGAVRRTAVRRNLMDVPNERSSHREATPRGGGAGIAISFLLAVGALCATQQISAWLWGALSLSGGAVAGIGYLDDRYHLGSASRFVTHLSAAVLFVIALGGYPSTQLAKWGLQWAWLGYPFSVLVLVWSTNLFNFMDGIDGIAGGEAVFVSAAGAVLIWISGGEAGLSAVLSSLAAANVGFLLWNWPPARIFMGDVGSGFLGFVLCACMMVASAQGNLPIEVLPILGGVFVCDATVTLLRRMLRGDRWLDAHRTHAYQWLARRYGTHRPVTIGVLLVNLLWLFPWALVTVRYPDYAREFLIAALLPLVIISIVVGAGRREVRPPAR